MSVGRPNDLRRLPGHHRIQAGRRRRAGSAGPRSSWPPRVSRSPARPTSSATWPGSGPMACSSVTPAGSNIAPARHPVRGRLLAERLERADRRVAEVAGALRVTASYDLTSTSSTTCSRPSPPGWLEVVVHQQIPMFHMEHCVFCAFLSPGTDKTNCGRPCDAHYVKLRDRVGMEHPLKADVGCRNTLFNAAPQTAAEYLPRLLSPASATSGWSSSTTRPADVTRTLGLYRDVSRAGATPEPLARVERHRQVRRDPRCAQRPLTAQPLKFAKSLLSLASCPGTGIAFIRLALPRPRERIRPPGLAVRGTDWARPLGPVVGPLEATSVTTEQSHEANPTTGFVVRGS